MPILPSTYSLTGSAHCCTYSGHHSNLHLTDSCIQSYSPSLDHSTQPQRQSIRRLPFEFGCSRQSFRMYSSEVHCQPQQLNRLYQRHRRHRHLGIRRERYWHGRWLSQHPPPSLPPCLPTRKLSPGQIIKSQHTLKISTQLLEFRGGIRTS